MAGNVTQDALCCAKNGNDDYFPRFCHLLRMLLHWQGAEAQLICAGFVFLEVFLLIFLLLDTAILGGMLYKSLHHGCMWVSCLSRIIVLNRHRLASMLVWSMKRILYHLIFIVFLKVMRHSNLDLRRFMIQKTEIKTKIKKRSLCYEAVRRESKEFTRIRMK